MNYQNFVKLAESLADVASPIAKNSWVDWDDTKQHFKGVLLHHGILVTEGSIRDSDELEDFLRFEMYDNAHFYEENEDDWGGIFGLCFSGATYPLNILHVTEIIEDAKQRWLAPLRAETADDDGEKFWDLRVESETEIKVLQDAITGEDARLENNRIHELFRTNSKIEERIAAVKRLKEKISELGDL